MSQTEVKYHIKRYDQTQDRSLRAWSAADEYLLQAFSEISDKTVNLALYHDRFGFLSAHLHTHQPATVIINKSQEKAIVANFRHHHISAPEFCNPLETREQPIGLALMKVPKSLGLFKLYLEHISRNASPDINVICAFMTRHYSQGLLDIANEYFEVVEQSKAWKKSRLLTLSKMKEPPGNDITDEVTFRDHVYKQYHGVFSAEHVDYGTQFFLENVQVTESDKCIMDLASGNGIIGNELLKMQPAAEMHFVDDSILAVASSKLNVKGANVHHHWADDLSGFEEGTFDLIVTNPPFHFEYENNIYVTLELLKSCYRCLKNGGRLQLVGNRHLNYKTHLDHLFRGVEVVAESERYVAYKCIKKSVK